MERTVDDFLAYEIEETHKNIDRIRNHLHDTPDTIAYSGRRIMLAIQREHLEIIQDLRGRVANYGELVSICRQNIIDNERQHSKIGSKEHPIHSEHSSKWWSTLHLIQFWSDFLSRVHTYQKRYTKDDLSA